MMHLLLEMTGPPCFGGILRMVYRLLPAS